MIVGPPKVRNRIADPAAIACHLPMKSAPSPRALPGKQFQSSTIIIPSYSWKTEFLNFTCALYSYSSSDQKPMIGDRKMSNVPPKSACCRNSLSRSCLMRSCSLLIFSCLSFSAVQSYQTSSKQPECLLLGIILAAVSPSFFLCLYSRSFTFCSSFSRAFCSSLCLFLK